MGRIDVEKAIEELTLGEKVDLTAGKSEQTQKDSLKYDFLCVRQPRDPSH